jgi:CheY-like chemotaxis protein
MSAAEPIVTGEAERRVPFRGPEVVRLLVGTARDWYGSALRTLLEPEDFVIEVVAEEPALIRAASEWRPSLVLLDYELEAAETTRLCRELYREALPWSVPLVVSVAGALEEGLKADVFESGAWLVLSEPLFFGSLLAQLRKLAEVGFVAETGAARRAAGESDLPVYAEARRSFGMLASLAERRGDPLTCVVAGPTTPGLGATLERQKRTTAQLCARTLRASDACAWSDADDGDVVILAYGASAEGARVLVERLNRAASGRAELTEEPRVLSAGIREILPVGDAVPSTGTGSAAKRLQSEELAAAHSALQLVRQAGGGVRVAGAR